MDFKFDLVKFSYQGFVVAIGNKNIDKYEATIAYSIFYVMFTNISQYIIPNILHHWTA